MIGSLVNFKSADGTTDYFLNDQTSRDGNFLVSPYYYVKLESADYAGTDISTEVHPLPHVHGEVAGDTLRRGRGISLSGIIQARGIQDLESGAQYLQQVFWDTRERQLIWTPINSTVNVYLKCYVNNDISVARNIPQTFTLPTWAWTVGLRASDPVIYKLSDDTPFESWMTETVDSISITFS